MIIAIVQRMSDGKRDAMNGKIFEKEGERRKGA
jgi:hypothetical protein